jgi:hypothetical protein
MPNEEEHKKLYEDWLIHGTRIHTEYGGTLMNPDIINHPLTKMELSMYSRHRNYNDEAFVYLSNLIKKIEMDRLALNPPCSAKQAVQLAESPPMSPKNKDQDICICS